MKRMGIGLLAAAMLLCACAAEPAAPAEPVEPAEVPAFSEEMREFCEAVLDGPFTLRVEDPATGDVRVYDVSGAMRTAVGYAAPAETISAAVMSARSNWQSAAQSDWDDWCAAESYLQMTFSAGEYTIGVVGNAGVVRLERGGTVRYGQELSNEVSELFLDLAAQAAEYEVYGLCVDGALTCGEAAQALCAQLAERLDAAPAWFPGKPEAAFAAQSEVYDTYRGAEGEVFCFTAGLYLRFESAEAGIGSRWNAGGGMIEPDGAGEHGDCFLWSTDASAARDADGNWVLTGTFTDHSSAREIAGA